MSSEKLFQPWDKRVKPDCVVIAVPETPPPQSPFTSFEKFLAHANTAPDYPDPVLILNDLNFVRFLRISHELEYNAFLEPFMGGTFDRHFAITAMSILEEATHSRLSMRTWAMLNVIVEVLKDCRTDPEAAKDILN